MEQSLTTLFRLNETLISEKYEIRKKLFEKCINSFEDTSREDSCFFNRISSKMNDKEYENLKNKYEKLRYLISAIDELKKEEF